ILTFPEISIEVNNPENADGLQRHMFAWVSMLKEIRSEYMSMFERLKEIANAQDNPIMEAFEAIIRNIYEKQNNHFGVDAYIFTRILSMRLRSFEEDSTDSATVEGNFIDPTIAIEENFIGFITSCYMLYSECCGLKFSNNDTRLDSFILLLASSFVPSKEGIFFPFFLLQWDAGLQNLLCEKSINEFFSHAIRGVVVAVRVQLNHPLMVTATIAKLKKSLALKKYVSSFDESSVSRRYPWESAITAVMTNFAMFQVIMNLIMPNVNIHTDVNMNQSRPPLLRQFVEFFESAAAIYASYVTDGKVMNNDSMSIFKETIDAYLNPQFRIESDKDLTEAINMMREKSTSIIVGDSKVRFMKQGK
ncbi:MAG: hypothetical protein LBB15_00720, partial [Puniceicoccales bacterium]|nr:hypothetical protein [Puniceicoccales bacterium]